MTAPTTIRARIERAAAGFDQLEGVVLTTFTLNTPFLEEHVLAACLGVDASTSDARRAGVHQRLGEVPCTVFYDPATKPRIGHRFRYEARPVPVRGRFFHPKLVVLAGIDLEGVDWVYLAVSSANLTLSGWGRNVEGFGETWIHTRRQRSHGELDALLAWLEDHGALGDAQAGRRNAVDRIRTVLARMPSRRRFHDDGNQAWTGTLHHRLYSSVVHRAGLADYLRFGRSRRPKELWAYSPFWGNVADNVKAFNAKTTVLVPAKRADGRGVGLDVDQAGALPKRVELQMLKEDDGSRFWHMKAYRILHGKKGGWTAVGSCNFTANGLKGAGGNVEAMLVTEHDGSWLPEGDVLPDDALALKAVGEEEGPEPVPIAIIVAWDWRSATWRWWLDAGPQQKDALLVLPGCAELELHDGTGEHLGSPPPRGAEFTVRWRGPAGQESWTGPIVELHLDYSARSYGRPLTANQILASWQGRAPTWDIGGGGGPGEGDGEDEEQAEDCAAFDAVNLYELYRAMRGLRTRLDDLAPNPSLQRAHLVGRPDSVMSLAWLADRGVDAPMVRYLVLRELCGVVRDWAQLLDADLVARADLMAADARARTRAQLDAELGSSTPKADAMLDWFEERLSDLDGGAT